MKILREAADQQLLKPFRSHGWETVVSSEDISGEYLIVEAKKGAMTRRVALLYTSATDNRHYKALDAAVDHIFTNGALYHIESFTHGIAKPVSPIGEFFPVLVGWNKELVPDTHKLLPPARRRRVRQITGENPLAGIWSRLDQFASVTLAEKLITRRATEESIVLTPYAIRKKAEGVAFAMRNASDYFRGVPFESLNRRIVTLYYGSMALAFAEMLASPQGPADLDEVEGMTKYGHGLYVLPSGTGDYGGLNVGVIASGFFPRWAAFLGHDISAYPKEKAKSQSDLEKKPAGTLTTLRELLGALPELGDLFLEVFQTAPSWIAPVFIPEGNSAGRGLQKPESTYIRLIDASGRISEAQIRAADWPITEITLVTAGAEDGSTYRARVDHAGREYWYEVLPVHHSPFKKGSTLILPVIGGMSEFRTVAVITLYALSILVRYMPSAWRRVEGGDWDEHLSLVKNALGVFERLIPEQFLESIIGEQIYASQPGGLL